MLLEEGHIYSYSQLEQMDSCPYGYYMQRIEHVDETDNAFAQQGSLIHELIDEWAKGELPANQLVTAYRLRYPDEVTAAWPIFLASKGYADKTYQQGLDYFTNFDEFQGYKIIGTEQKFVMELLGRPFQGIIDMILEESDGKLILLDHKSKSLSSFRKNQDTMYRQLYIYAKYIYDQYHKWPDKLVFNLFKEGGKKMERLFNEEEYKQTLDWAEKTMNKIESFDEIDFLETRKSDFYCWELCSVRDNCPNGNQK